MPKVQGHSTKTEGKHFRQITRAHVTTITKVLYICIPERTDYGYAASNIVAIYDCYNKRTSAMNISESLVCKISGKIHNFALFEH